MQSYRRHIGPVRERAVPIVPAEVALPWWHPSMKASLTVATFLVFNKGSVSAFSRNYAPWQWRSRATDPHTESSSVKTTDEVVKFYAPWSTTNLTF